MKIKFWLLAVIIAFSVLLSSFGFYFWQIVYSPNILVSQGPDKRDDTFIYIPSGSTFEDVMQILHDGKIYHDEMSFRFMAKMMDYPQQVKAGRFLLRENTSNREAISILRSGEQVPLNVTFNNIRTKEELAIQLCRNLEADRNVFLKLLNTPETVTELGFDTTTIMCMFLPNTYQFMWNTSAKDVLTRMHNEYKKYWNEERKLKAANVGLSPVEVSILASIVDSETAYEPEKPTVAGLYINRLQKSMKLESDPTVKFALRQFEIRRVLDKHLEIDSPYNTYKVRGLPPGPIRLPSISGLEAVLNYEKHDYIFMCANVDAPGHAFAKTGSEHARNAAAYHRWLNQQRIYE